MALEGMLSALKPALSIEIGTAEGGSLQRVAEHSGEVHSFDLVEPRPDIAAIDNVELHIGDSHALLPEFLEQLSDAGRNVDFVLVDGDHSSDGVRQDLEQLLASRAIGKTVVVVHDTLNDHVRRGVTSVDYGSTLKVRAVELDLVAGHLTYGNPFHHEMWGGLGLVLVDEDEGGAPPGRDADRFYDMFELIAPMRDRVIARETAGLEVRPGFVGEPPESEPAVALEARAEALERKLEEERGWMKDLRGSLSWRLTAPLRAAKRRVRDRP